MLIPLDENETRKAIDATKGVLALLERAPPREKLEEYKQALEALREAVRITNPYQEKVRATHNRDRETEDKLSEVWFRVAGKIGEFDPQVAELCRVKGMGWASERIWDRPEYRDLPLSLEEMLILYTNNMRKADTYEAAMEALERVTTLVRTKQRDATAAQIIARSSWVNGSFYLVALLAMVFALGWIAQTVPWYYVPAVIIGGIVAMTVVGALQLMQDQKLSQEAFLTLMGMAFRQLPLVKIISRRPKSERPKE